MPPARARPRHPPAPAPPVYPYRSPHPFTLPVPPLRIPVVLLALRGALFSAALRPRHRLAQPPPTPHPPTPSSILQDVRGGASAGKSGKSGIVTKNAFDGKFTDAEGKDRKISWVGNRDYQIDGAGACSPSHTLTTLTPLHPLHPCTPLTAPVRAPPLPPFPPPAFVPALASTQPHLTHASYP